MAEIRVRNAEPKLLEQLDLIGKELNESTISGTLEKLIPRYHEMHTRIQEQNKQLGDLSQLLRAHENLKSNFINEYEDYISEVFRLKNVLIRLEKTQTKELETIKLAWKKPGTKNEGGKRKPKQIRKPGKKIVPAKKKVAKSKWKSIK